MESKGERLEAFQPEYLPTAQRECWKDGIRDSRCKIQDARSRDQRSEIRGQRSENNCGFRDCLMSTVVWILVMALIGKIS